MRELIAVIAEGDLRFVDTMRRIWDDGDAFLPVDPRLPGPARERLFEALRPAAVVDPDGERHALAGGEPVEDGDAAVIATSGSTGVPKGAVHTHTTLAAMCEATNAGIGVDPERDRWLCSLPLAHVAGLSVVLRSLHNGTPFEILPTFSVEACEAAARERGCTLTTLVPTALVRIDASLYRRIVVGAAPPPDMLPDNVLVSYGMTESGSAVAYDGLPLPGVELRVVDGEIHVRGPMLLRAYRDGRDPKDADGWFATGDGGELDADGRLVVHGRTGEMINTGGEKVWPVEVEQVLALHPAVADVAVIGRPHPEWGATVTAVVVPTDPAAPPTLDELRTHCREHLHPWAAPRGLELTDALPKTLLGKIQRARL